MERKKVKNKKRREGRSTAIWLDDEDIVNNNDVVMLWDSPVSLVHGHDYEYECKHKYANDDEFAYQYE